MAVVKALTDTLDNLGREAGNEKGNRSIDHFVLIVTEMLYGSAVNLENMTVGIGNHYSVIHPRQKLAEQRFTVFGHEKWHNWIILYQIIR